MEPEKAVQLIREIAEAGTSPSEISFDLHVPYPTIQSWLIGARKPNKYNPVLKIIQKYHKRKTG